MKTTLMICTVSAICATTCLSDMLVRLNNKDSNMPIYMWNGGQLASGNVYVEVTASVDYGPSVAVDIYGTSISSYKITESGYFDEGVGIIPGMYSSGNHIVYFQVYAWTGGSTYETASVTGVSSKWYQIISPWDPNSGLPASGPSLLIPNSITLNAGPEPGAIALGILGGAALITNKAIKAKMAKPKLGQIKTKTPIKPN